MVDFIFGNEVLLITHVVSSLCVCFSGLQTSLPHMATCCIGLGTYAGVVKHGTWDMNKVTNMEAERVEKKWNHFACPL